MKQLSFVSQHGFLFAFITASASMLGSLYFSEVLKVPPCNLCWYQRLASYPQVLILGIAFLKNDYSVKKYLLPLSIFGFAVASYQSLLQVFPEYFPCSDAMISCKEGIKPLLGFITIPLMSAVSFVLMFFFVLIQKSKK